MPGLAANITLLFRERPLLERVGAAHRAGFAAIECLWPYEISAKQFKDECQRHGLTVALINTPLGQPDDPHFGLAASASRRPDFVALFNDALRYADDAGAQRIHVMVGEYANDRANRDALVSNLREAGRRAADAGITLVIEPINGRDRPNWFMKSTEQALDILAEVDLSSVKLLFDIYHVQIIEGDLTRRLEACIDKVGHVQVAGVPARHEPDDSEVDTANVFRTLDRLGYAGWIGCEYNPRGDTRAGLAWAAPFGITPRDGEEQ